jgi:hypothetical protein
MPANVDQLTYGRSDLEYLKFFLNANSDVAVRVASSSGTLNAGTKATASGSAVALATSTTSSRVTVQADPANTVGMYVGNASSQPILLYAGDSIVLDVNNVSIIYIKRTGSTNVTANWVAT